MKLFVIGVAFAYNPFEIQNEIPDCFDQCGGIGGKCEEITVKLIYRELIFWALEIHNSCQI